MKQLLHKITILAAAIFISITASSKKPNTISITLTPSVTTVQSGMSFYIDAQVSYDATCGTPSLQMTLPANVVFLSMGAHPWGPTATVSMGVLTVTFTSPPTSGSVITNFQVNLKLAEGVVCNNTAFVFKMDFITQNCGTVTSSPVTVTGLASLQISMTSSVADGDSCVGGYMFYDIAINYVTTIGAYNLSNVQISFNTNGATCVGIGTVNYLNMITGSQPFTMSGTNAIFNIGNLIVTNYFQLRFRIGLKYPCGTFNAPYTGIHAITLTGLNPCGTNSTLTANQPVNLPVNCCSGGTQPPLLQKTLTSWIANFCPGSCQNSVYALTFNNAYGTTTYNGVVIEDVIPPQINVTQLSSDVFNQYSYGTVQLQFQKNGVATWITGPTFASGNINTPVSSLPGWVVTDYLSRVKWIYNNPIPPGMVITNYLSFFVISPDHNGNPVNPGNIVTNTMNGSSTSPPYSGTLSLPKTVNTCPVSLGRQKFINDNGNLLNSKNALPGDTIKFRLVINNYGNTPINSLSVNDLLNTNFTFITGSDKYFYGSNILTPSTSFLGLSPYNSSSPPTGSLVFTPVGNNLTWTIPALPGSCTSSNYLLIEIDAKVNASTPAGNYGNSFKVTYNSTPYNSNTVFVNVNDYYRAVPQMFVQCPLNGTWDSTVKVKAGDIVQFKYRIKNVGNVSIKGIKLVNQKPMLSDLEVVNYTTARNSQFTVDYDCSFAAVTVPSVGPTPVTLNYDILGNNYCRNDVNFPGLPGSCTNPTWSAPCNVSANDLKITLNPAFTLAPGNDVDVILQGKVSATATLGQIANNSFGFIGIRTDLNILTTSAESNEVQMQIDTVGCYTPPPKDSCKCGEWSHINWQYMNNETGNPPSLQCGSTINVNCNQPIMITPSYSCVGQNCNASYSLSINNVNYTFVGNSFPNIVFNTSGNYNGMLIAYCNGKPCDTCRFTIHVVCPGNEDCHCKSWQSITMNSETGSSTALQCNGQYNVSCHTAYTISFNYSCSGPNCTPKYYVKLNPPGGPFTLLTGNTWTHTFTTAGLYSLTVVPVCGTDTCAPCTIRFYADCQSNECHCGEWGTITVIPKPLPNVDYHPFPVQCGGTYTLDCNEVISIKPQYYCVPSNCVTTYTMTINNVSYPFNTGSGTFDNISFSTSGIYTVVITPYCNGVACPPCKIYFNVNCDHEIPPDCCKEFKADIHGGTLTYAGGSVQNLSLTGITVSGMTPNKMTISVVSATISGSSCGQNGPVGVGITSVTTNTTGLGTVSMLNQPYGKDIALLGTSWNNGSNIGFNFNALLKPNCKDTLKICVKITFYDKDCRACSIYRCFTVARKWKKVVGTSVPVSPAAAGAMSSLLASLNDLEKQLNRDNSNVVAVSNAKLAVSAYRSSVQAVDYAIKEGEDKNNLSEKMAAMNMQFLALQEALQKLSQQYTTISNVLKSKHDTVKNSISNIR
jgi:uncharacterized repeat protein (TIGR01451 family)